MILQKGLDVARGYLTNPQQLNGVVDEAALTLRKSLNASVCFLFFLMYFFFFFFKLLFWFFYFYLKFAAKLYEQS